MRSGIALALASVAAEAKHRSIQHHDRSDGNLAKH